jgi:putative transposase
MIAPQVSAQISEWMSAAQMAELALPDFPATESGIIRRAKRDGWQRPDREWTQANPLGIWRKRDKKQGGGVEYHYSLLPAREQAKLLQAAAIPAAPPTTDAKRSLSAAEMWTWFDRQPDKAKDKARKRLAVLDAVEAMVRNGVIKEHAVPLNAAAHGVSTSSIWGWYKRVGGQDRADWLPFLCAQYVGRQAEAEFTPEAWEYFKSDYLRLSEPALTACYRRLTDLAKQHGWSVPSDKSVARKVEREIHPTILTLTRQGPDELKKMFPPQERDRSCFHALEAINGDGHVWDVNVLWPDGTTGRPMMVGFQDLYSNKLLSWRIDTTENREVIRLALGDVVEQYGIPEYVWFDNTRAFANKWLTGGAANRNRWKQRDEDPLGICETLGMQVRFTLPYSGQSKPIERSWRDMAGDIAKHPAFEGAYTGNSTTNKPANYGERAIPLDEFLKVISSEIAKWNAREGRRTKIAAGRSFDQVFAESYAKASDQGLIRTATPEQARLWLLAAEGVSADRDNGAIKILKNRFWSEWLQEHRGEKLVIRYDPQNVLDGLHVYALSGAYLGFADIWEASGFANADDARRHASARKAFFKATKLRAAAERTMTALEVAAMQPEAEPAPLPEPGNVQRVVFGNTVMKPVPAPMDQPDPEAFDRGVQQLFRLVTNND